MTTIAETITPQKVLEFSQSFSSTDIQWLIKQLKKQLEEKPLPDHATLPEAIELYLEDKCSLGRAAELAGVTRWDIQDALFAQGISIEIDSNQSVEEMDAMTKRLEQKGFL
jgi:predicted HTH domain antitoxin